MRVAINTRLLIQNKMDGIGRYAFEVLKRITKNNPKVEFHFIFDRPFSSDFIFEKNIIPHVLSPQARHPILWYIWVEIQLPRLIRKINPDIFFSTDGFMPSKLHTPSITTIHDINFEHRPGDLTWTHSFFYRKYFKEYAKKAQHIITVSHFSKKDIINKYAIEKEKISVVYNGVSEKFRKINNSNKTKIKVKYAQGQDFFIFIGSLHKRKNIHNLLLAFDDYKQNKGQYKLLIIGEEKWLDKKTKKTYKKMMFQKDVKFLGRMGDSELPIVLGSAQALCFVSLFEGFGLPILESMKASVPVITSNKSAMPEIAKDAAILVDPCNIKDISNALYSIEKDEKMKIKLIQKGNARVLDFNWDNSAQKIWEIIKNNARTTIHK